MTDRERIAQIIREAADRSKLSNQEIANRARVSKSTITEAIRGTYGMKLETLAQIVEACGAKLDVRLVFPPTFKKDEQVNPQA